MKCNIKIEGGQITVTEDNGQPSELFRQAKEFYGSQNKAVDLWSMTKTDEFKDLIDEENVTLDEALKFIDVVNSNKNMFSADELMQVRDFMERNQVESLSELSSSLNTIFKQDGTIGLDEQAALDSGMYTREDLETIDLVEVGKTLTKLDGTLKVTDIEIEVDGTLYDDVKSQKKTIFETSERMSLEEVSKVVIEEIQPNLTDEEFMLALQELPFNDLYEQAQEDKAFFKQLKDSVDNTVKLQKVEIGPDGELRISTSKTYETVKSTLPIGTNTSSLRARLNKLLSFTDFAWSREDKIRKVLVENVENFSNYNIDLVGLDNLWNNREQAESLVATAIQLLENPTEENIQNFADIKDELLGEDSAEVAVKLDSEYNGLNIVRMETALTNEELFSRFGLIKIADNTYHKVSTEESLDDVYEYLYDMYLNDEIEIPAELKSINDKSNPSNKVAVLKDLSKYINTRKTGIELGESREKVSALQVAYNHIAIPATTPQQKMRGVSKVITPTEELINDFVPEFYNYYIREKQKGSEIYNRVLSKLRFTERGIIATEYIGSLQGVEHRVELEDYIRLKRDSDMDHLVDEGDGVVAEDLQALNYPETVQEQQGTYLIKDEFLILPNTSKMFAKVNGRLFRQVLSKPNQTLYQEISLSEDQVYFEQGVEFEFDVERATEFFNDHELTLAKNSAERSQEILEGAKFNNVEELQPTTEGGQSSRASQVQDLEGNTYSVNESDITTYETESGPIRYITNENGDMVMLSDKNTGTIPSDSNDIRHQIISEKGASQVLEYKESLDEAKKMHTQGVSLSEIEDKTKWYLFKGNWRRMSPEVIQDFRIKDNTINKVLTLKDVLGNENVLFNFYPQLRETKVVFADTNLQNVPVQTPKDFEKSNGLFHEDSNTIVINTRNAKTQSQQEYTLSHEVVHSVQKLEGLPKGGGLTSVLSETLDILNLEGNKPLPQIYQEIFSADKSKLTNNEKKIVQASVDTISDLVLGRVGNLQSQYLHLMGEIDANIVEGAMKIRDNSGFIETSYSNLLNFYNDFANINTDNILLLKNGNVRFNINETNKNAPIEVVQEVVSKLQETGLATEVVQDNTEGLNKVLQDLGVSEEIRAQLEAWHGSPHLFDRFSTSAMGTGEGAQAFGWGLYFTDLESIARNYADNENLIERHLNEVYDFNIPDRFYQIPLSVRNSKSKLIPYINKQIKGFEEAGIQAQVRDWTKLKDAVEGFNVNLYKASLHKGKTPITSAEYRAVGPLVINRDISKAKGEYGSKEPLVRFDTHEEAVAWLEAEDAKAEYAWLEWDKSLTEGQIEKLLEDDISGEVAEALVNYYSETHEIDTTEDLIETMYTSDINGGELYRILSENIGETPSPKEASLSLLRAGIDGIKYPAESIARGATSDNARGFNYVVFDENVITIEEVIQFQKELSDKGVTATPNGFVHNGKVYLNTDNLNIETPIHEFGHLYNSWLKETSPEKYKKGIDLIKEELNKGNSEIQTAIDYVKETQPDLTGERLHEEILTQVIGTTGADIVNSNSNSSIAQWLRDVWNSIKNTLGLSEMTVEQVVNMNIGEYSQAIATDLLRAQQIGQILTPTTENKTFTHKGVEIHYKKQVNPITEVETGAVEVDLITTPRELRGQGLAREAMQEFVKLADRQGLSLYLIASPRDKTTTTEGLIDFYESVGFRSGRDFQEEMTRSPRRVSERSVVAQQTEVVQQELGYNEDLPQEMLSILHSEIKVLDLYDESQQGEIDSRLDECN